MSKPKITNEQALSSFMTARIVESSEEVPLRAFRVLHATEGTGKEKCVLDESFHDGFSPESAAYAMLSHMQQDANVSSSPQIYVVRAYYGHGDTKEIRTSGGRWAVKLKPELEDESDDEPLGMVSEQTMLAQAHRLINQTQSAAWLSIGEMSSQVTGLARSVMESQARQQEAMSQQQTQSLANFQRMMEALDTRAVRELQVAKDLKKEERIDAGIKMLMQYLPVYLADKSSSPGTAIEMMFDSLNQDQIIGIANQLEPSQRQVLIQAISAKAQKAKANQESEQALNEKVRRIASTETPRLNAAPAPAPEAPASAEQQQAPEAEPEQLETGPEPTVAEKLLASLSSDQLAAIFETLGPEQRALAMQAMAPK